jgi:hypothetical protein
MEEEARPQRRGGRALTSAPLVFAGDLATFLEQAIARLDSLGAAPPEQLGRPQAAEQPQAEKLARKSRKKEVPAEGSVGEAPPGGQDAAPDVVAEADTA